MVSSYQPYRTAIAVHDFENIRFRSVHVDSDSKAAFNNTLLDEPFSAEVREHEFASLTII